MIHPILLTAIMRYNLDWAEEKFSNIGRVILDKDLGSARDNAVVGIEKLDEFFASFDVPLRLRDEISAEDKHFLEPICRMAVNDACNLTNPRPASWRELMAVCEEVW